MLPKATRISSRKVHSADANSHPRSFPFEKPFYEARGVTIGQLALLWLYAHRSILSALPNIYNQEQLVEFAGASEHAPLTDGEMESIHEMYERKFDVAPYVEEPAAV